LVIRLPVHVDVPDPDWTVIGTTVGNWPTTAGCPPTIGTGAARTAVDTARTATIERVLTLPIGRRYQVQSVNCSRA
jgi:hypothetical protein